MHKIITISGNMQHWDEILNQATRLSIEGNIVLIPFKDPDKENIPESRKNMYDEVHNERIEMSEELFVVNKDGYIGNSTRKEILHAFRNNKHVEFLERPSIEYLGNLLLNLTHFQRIAVLRTRFKILMGSLLCSLYYHYFLSENNKYNFIQSTSDISRFQTDIDLLFESTKHSMSTSEEFDSDKFYQNIMSEVYDDNNDTLAAVILPMLPNMKVDFESVISCTELTMYELVYSTPSELITRLKNK